MAQTQTSKKEELLIDSKSFFDFYKKHLGESIRKRGYKIEVDFMQLSEFSNSLAEEILTNPEEALQILEQAIEESGLVDKARVRLINLPEVQRIEIRKIRAKHLNELVFLEGIIRQASDVRPQVVSAKFECPSCGSILSVLQMDKKFSEPLRCSCGRRAGFKIRSKEMVDTQRLVVEEASESLIGGEQPKRMDVFLREDLVEPRMEEKTTPGSRVRVIGVLKEVQVPLRTGGVSTRFGLVVEANNVVPLEETFEEFEISEEDEKDIFELSQDSNIFDNLAKSIAPSIWGYDEIKKSLVLQLFGGVKKIHSDGQHSRGDLHVLLIGDPGVAKSIGSKERILYYSKREAGYEEIQNLFSKFGKNPKDLNVLTINQKTHSFEWAKVEELVAHPPEKKLVKITTSHGKSIIATKDHSFITLSSDGEIQPIKGEDIKKETYLPIPINYHRERIQKIDIKEFKTYEMNSKKIPDEIVLNESAGFFFGIFLSEGYVKSGKVVTISNRNKKIKDRIYRFARSLKLNSSFSRNEVIINSKSLSNVLRNFCYNEREKEENKTKGNLSRIKRIPDFTFFAPREFIKGVISGLFSGDGRFVKENQRIKGFELVNVSERLSQGTSDLLFSLGILNDVRESKYVYKGKKTNCYVVFVSAQSIKKFRRNFNFYGKTFLKYPNPIYSYNNLVPCGDLVYNLTKKLGYNSRKSGNRTFAAEMRTVKKRGVIGRLRLRRIIRMFEQRTKEKLPELGVLKKIAYSSIIWSKVKEVKNVRKEDKVYDLVIPKTNTFVSNGIGVHNSVTLNFMATISPKGRYVVGRSASGAGLTATVVRDEYLRGWSLEAGAMVLANRGLVCIDELEKMDPTDRSAMHEAMEQQSITISKANVQATLRSETSVLAAANPKFGRFDPNQSIGQQLDLPPTLINRFDVLFALRDLPDERKDLLIADHVLNEHKREGKRMLIDKDLFRKYVAYAKQRVEPKLSKEAIDEIKNFYVTLRNKPVSSSEHSVRTVPITARQLQALVRLSEAAAKVRLSETVSVQDAKVAIDIMKYSLMQVGYDPELKTFDIDRISSSTSASQRSKIMKVKNAIFELENRLGQMIPLEELEKELEGDLTRPEIEEAIDKLARHGEIFRPKHGYISQVK